MRARFVSLSDVLVLGLRDLSFYARSAMFPLCSSLPLFASLSPEREIEFFFSSRRRHTISVSAFLLNRSSDLVLLQYLGYDATPFNQILKQNAKREMRLR